MNLSASGVDVVVTGERFFLSRQAKCDVADAFVRNVQVRKN